MNIKKLRAIILLFAILLLIIVIISTMINSMSNKKKNTHNVEVNEANNHETAYNFNQTIDLDEDDIITNSDSQMGTDYPSFGVISNYYDNADIHYGDGKVYVESPDGYDVVSYTWQNEGFATYINEPNFGQLEKFVLSPESISVKYSNVKMKDTISYINELSGLGFNEILTNNKNNSADYYIYSAKKGEITVTLNYEKGNLVIMVY